MRTQKFKDLFWFGPKSNIKAGDGLEKGRFPFYTSSPKLTKWIDKEQHFDEALIFGTGGLASVHFEDQPFSTSTDCIVAITTNKEIKTKFVYYFLFGNIHLLERGFKGAGLKHISKKYIENLDIPVLPIETQNKIVAILDKASSIVDKRNETVKILSTLLRATFLDMFGDPTISRKYEIGNLTNYVSRIQIGPFGSQLHRADYIEGGIPLINPINIIENKIVPDLSITIKKEKYHSLPNYHLVEGDIIMARRGEMGRCGLITKKEDGFFCGTGSLFVRPNKETDSTFLLYCLTNEGVIKYLNNSAKGITMKNLNKSILQNIPLINVPFADQKLFKNKVDAIEKTLNACLTSIAELNLLFKSILQKVFNGQLNFNVDFELDALIRKIDIQKKENEEYSATDNDRTEPKPIINIKAVKKTEADNKIILFNETEGNAIFNKVFSIKAKGFGFDEFETFLKTAGFTYEYQQLKDFIFNKLENKEIIQFYSNEEWRKNNYKKNTNPLQDDFAGDGRIYLVPNQIKK